MTKGCKLELISMFREQTATKLSTGIDMIFLPNRDYKFQYTLIKINLFKLFPLKYNHYSIMTEI